MGSIGRVGTVASIDGFTRDIGCVTAAGCGAGFSIDVRRADSTLDPVRCSVRVGAVGPIGLAAVSTGKVIASGGRVAQAVVANRRAGSPFKMRRNRSRIESGMVGSSLIVLKSIQHFDRA